MAGKENDQPSKQIEAFKAAARALGCDEDKEKFEAQLGKVAEHKRVSPDVSRKGVRGRSDKKKG